MAANVSAVPSVSLISPRLLSSIFVNPDSGNLDKASLSRFGNILRIGLPDKNEILASLKFHMNKSEDVKNSKFFNG